MSVFSNASPTERFKISETAVKRMRRGKGKDQFEWSAFVAMREQVAREQLHGKPATWRRVVAVACDRVIIALVRFRLMVLND